MRKGLFTVIALALVLIVPSAMLLAQEKPAAPKAAAKEMKLTDEQKAKLETFRLDQKMKTIDARAELEKQAIVLKKELMKDEPNMAEVEATLKKMADARTKMQMIRIAGMLEMRKTFGPDWRMHMRGSRPGMGAARMGNEGEGCEGTEATAPRAMAPFGVCRGERGPMERARKVIKMRRGGGEGRPGMRSGMPGMMMWKKGEGCSMGSMEKSGDKCVVIMKEGAGSCTKEKNAGCAQGAAEGCGMMKMRAPRAMAVGGCMKEMAAGCAKAAGMGGACSTHQRGGSSCASKDESWRHRHLYRPHFGAGCSGEMKAGCGGESSCKGTGAHKCSGACKKEIKVKVEAR